MEFHLKPLSADFSCRFLFKEPILDILKGNQRISLIGEILGNFNISIDALKYDTGPLSSKAIEFSKFFGDVWFNVSIGVERVDVVMNPIPEGHLIKDRCSALYNIFDTENISKHELTIHSHFAVEEGVDPFLESLNPYCPEEFSKFLKGRGISYNLEIPEHELLIYITIINSLLYPDAVYTIIVASFSSNKYDFQKAFDLLSDYSQLILKGLKADLKREG
jgi:hypothetical protein